MHPGMLPYMHPMGEFAIAVQRLTSLTDARSKHVWGTRGSPVLGGTPWSYGIGLTAGLGLLCNVAAHQQSP